MSWFRRRDENATESSYLRQLISDYFNNYISLSDANKKTSILRLCERIATVGMALYEKGKIEFSATETNPYCDKPRIVIPTIWAMPEFWEICFNVDKNESLAQAICGIMGAVTHESAHNIYTESSNLLELAKRHGTRQDEEYLKFLCQVINIVEDMYIDEECRYEPRTRRLSKFTDYMRNITNKLDFDKLAEFEPEYMRNLGYISGLLSLEYLEQPSLLYDYVDANIVDFAVQSYNIHDFTDRILHAVELCDMLLDGVSEEQMKEDAQKAKQQGEGEGDEDCEISFGDGNGEGKPVDFNSLSKKTQEKIKEFLEKNAEKIESQTKTINKAITDKVKELKELDSQEFVKIKPKVPRLAGEGLVKDNVQIASMGSAAYSNWVVDKGWAAFSRHINNSRSFENKSPTLKVNGYDIDIDSIPDAFRGEKRIFIDNMARRVKAAPQVIIRADGSGSTHYCPNGGDKTLRQMILEATYGMMQSLIKVNVPFFAFMDTTGYSGNGEALTIFKLGCNMLPLNYDLGDKANKNAHNIYDRCRNMENTASSGNNDGYALEYGSMFATDMKREKVMISVSDGAPSSSRDSNLSATEYTKQVIGNLRKQGWKVFSISLIPEVVKYNDAIYGQAYNVDASKDINGALISLGKQLLKVS